MLTGKWGYPKAFSFYPVESLYKILALFLSGFLLALVFYVLIFFNIVLQTLEKNYVGIFMQFCFGIFNWKENKKVGTICFELRIPKKETKIYLETFSVSFLNEYSIIWFGNIFRPSKYQWEIGLLYKYISQIFCSEDKVF